MPPYPVLVIGENLKKLLVLTEQKLAELNGIGFSLPNPDLFIVMAIRKEALLSSQIEGTQATMTHILTYETWAEVDNLDDVQEELKQKILKEKKASLRSIQLLDILFASPLTTINDMAEKLDISFQAASEQARLFLGLGILEELTGQKRSRRFAFAPYLKIVEE